MPEPSNTAPPPPKPRKRWLPGLRFSLRTLVILVLLVGSAGGLWWRWEPWALERAINVGSGNLNSVTFSPDGRFVLAVGYEPIGAVGGAVVCDCGSGEVVQRIRNDGSSRRWVTAAAFSPSNNTIAIGTSLGTVAVWTLKGDKPDVEFKGPIDLLFLAFSGDSKQLVGTTTSGSIKVWDAQSGTELSSFQHGEKGSNYGVFSPDGTKLATIGFDDSIRLWSLQDRKSYGLIKPEPRIYFLSAVFSADGRTLYTAADSKNAACAWDALTGERQPAPPFERLPRLGKVFSPDNGRKIVPTDGTDEWIWDTRKSEVIAKLPVRGVLSTCFSPDGERIATASDNALRIWRQRRPEGLPGLICSPELWSILVLAPMLVWSFWRDQKRTA